MTEIEMTTTLKAKFGEENVRITDEVEINVFGEMPNTNDVDWWFFGDLRDADIEERIRQL